MPGKKQVTKTQPLPKPVVDTGLYCFVNVARFHGIPADPAQLTHALAISAVMTEQDILRAAKELKLKAKAATVSYKDLAKLPLPAMVTMGDDGFAILAQIEGDKLLMLLPEGTAPVVLTADEFQKKWTGRIILLTQRFWQEKHRKFDIKWFIPTIIKYKKLLDIINTRKILKDFFILMIL